MKKIILLFMFATCLTFGQTKKVIKQQPKPQYTIKVLDEDVTISQYDFFKTIQSKYPSFLIPKKITNIYINNQLFESQYEETAKEYSLKIVLEPDNQFLTYDLDIVNKGIYKDSYRNFGGTIVKTELIGNEYNVYFNGKKEL